MGSLDVTLLVVAGLLALTVAVARLERRPLGTGSSDVGPGLILALGAAVMFWFTFMVGAAAVNAYTGGALHDLGPAVTLCIAMIGSAFFCGGAGLFPRAWAVLFFPPFSRVDVFFPPGLCGPPSSFVVVPFF